MIWLARMRLHFWTAIVFAAVVATACATQGAHPRYRPYCAASQVYDNVLPGRFWTEVRRPPANARDLRFQGSAKPDGYHDIEFWYVSDRGDTRLCAVSRFSVDNCPSLPRSCQFWDRALSADGKHFQYAEDLCICEARR